MVLKYADSGSLRCHLSDPSIELDWPTRCKLGINIVNGLTYLHEHNILHKNLVIINMQQCRNFYNIIQYFYINSNVFIFSLLII